MEKPFELMSEKLEQIEIEIQKLHTPAYELTFFQKSTYQ
jgi:hypothetical protein